MITRVRHSGSQEIESWSNVGSTNYQNRFDCIPSGLSYRPQRLTPKPKLYGIMNGTIDSELDTGRADLDDQGRYKVMMPFDISGVAPGLASRRIRMAQPYGGGGAGMSFPLVKGTEVIWTCIDGDIDRPIITGAVPNPLNPSVTTAGNNTSNVIKTTSGITMGFHDGSGSGGNSTGGGAGGGLAAQQQFQRIELDNVSQPDIQENDLPDQNTHQISAVSDSEYSIAMQQQYQSALSMSSSWQAGQDIEETDTNFQIHVPYDTTSGSEKSSYLRMGSKANNEAIEDVEIKSSTGWVDYTDGDRITVTQGEKTEYINGGNYNLNIATGAMTESDASYMWHNSFTDVGGGVWRRFVVDWTCESHISIGDSEELIGGAKFEGFVGLATGVNIGGELSATLAANVAVNGGYDFTFGSTLSNDLQENRLEITTIDHEMSAGKRVKVNVKPANAVAGAATNKTATAGVAAIGVTATAAIAGVPALIEALDSDGGNTGATILNSSLTGAAYGAATAIHASLCAKALADVAAHKLDGAEAVELDMSGVPPVVRLGIGSGVTSVAMPGLDISPAKITLGFGAGAQIVITPMSISIDSKMVTLNGTSAVSVGTQATGNTVVQGSSINVGTPAASVKIQGSAINNTATATATTS